MADVQPLRGLRYTPEKVPDLDHVITPPFDVISTEAQNRYYERDAHNIIRLELGKKTPEDDLLNNVYTRAATTFAEWRSQGIIQQETMAGYYLYEQHFERESHHYTRTSLLARVRLEPWDARVILPHENTRKKDKEDRLNLLHACSANFSPIMCMYDDPEKTLQEFLQTYKKAEADTQLTDENGEDHRLYPITDTQQIEFIQQFFTQRQLYIADGHHRYTTALQYRDELTHQRCTLDPQDGANFVLMALVAIEDPGMLVLPTYRIVYDLTEQQLQGLTEQQLGRYFMVELLDSTTTQQQEQHKLNQIGQEQIAILLKKKEQTLLLTLNAEGKQYMQASQHTPAWNVLDVAVVQKILFEELLGITEEDLTAGKSIRYTHEMTQVLQALEDDDVQAVVLLKGIPFQQVRDVALANDRMPPKSTYLYPKLITGLVINPLW